MRASQPFKESLEGVEERSTDGQHSSADGGLITTEEIMKDLITLEHFRYL